MMRGTPPGEAVQLALRARREQVVVRACDARAMADIGDRLVLLQRLEVVAARDALRELAQLRPREHFAQLRLADQDDLQELLRRGLEVREQAHLLQHVGVEVLRLVHHQHDAPAAAVGVEQEVREDVDQRLDAASGALRYLHVQLVADREQELGGRDARIQDQRDVAMRRQLLQQAAQHRRLAGADLAGELDEAAGLADAVGEMRERLRVPLAQVEVARVRRDRERLFVQPEEARVHDANIIPRAPLQRSVPRWIASSPKRPWMRSRASSSCRESAKSGVEKRSSCVSGSKSLTPTPSRRTAARGCSASQ